MAGMAAWGWPAAAAAVAGVPGGMAPPYPAAGARIVGFSGGTQAGDAGPSGPLVLRYSDGTVLKIPNESGDFRSDGLAPGADPAGSALPQVSFDNVAVAADQRTVGWLASYMVCAQSYACDAELVIFHFGRNTVVIRPATGIAVGWAFEDGGARVALFSAFPHGDDEGVCGLYDAASGKVVETYRPGQTRPAWVKDAAGDGGCH